MHFIFVWNPQFGHIGHVSMRVSEDVYISLWPEEDHGVFKYIFDIESPSKGCTYDEDCDAEGDTSGGRVIPRPPDREIEVEGELDVDDVRSWWEEAQHDGYSKTKNCINAVKLALNVGGLNKTELNRLHKELDDCYIYFTSQCVGTKGGKKNEPNTKKASKAEKSKRKFDGQKCQLKTGKKNNLCNVVRRGYAQKYCIGHGITE